MPLWQLEDLEHEISKETVLQCLDYSNTGVADADAVKRLQRKSDAAVLSWLGGSHGVQKLIASGDERLKDFALEYAVIAITKKHPDYVKRNWKDHFDVWRDEIRLLREGLTQLATDESPTPAANVQVYSDPIGGQPGDPLPDPLFNTDCFLF